MIGILMFGDAGSFMRHLSSSGNIHFPELLFPVFAIDTKTGRFVENNEATRAGVRFVPGLLYLDRVKSFSITLGLK